MKDNLIYIVINEILKEHNINANWGPPAIPEIDGTLNIDYKGHNERFFVEVKKELRAPQLNRIFELADRYKPYLVIAEALFPKIKDALREHEIAYVEATGNINIETRNLLLKVEGKNKNYLHPEKQGRAFTKTGLKAIYLFLTNENNINDTYRELARNANIAIGNMKLIREGLINEGFALWQNDKELKLTNKKELLQKWITAYNDNLKPALYMGKFKFNNETDFIHWKNLNLDNTMTKWGGEAAGNIYTNYLQPEVLTLYTNENKGNLIRAYKLLPDPEGNVVVYEKFWNDNQPNKNVVPSIIAYADLLDTGNRRCIETAQKIYEQFIDNTL
jgi:hypothetical protein